MSDKKQWRLPEIREKHVKRGDDLLTSHMSKPGAYGLTLPKIGNGRMMTQQTADIKYTGSDAKVSTHFPPLPVRALVPPEARKVKRGDDLLTSHMSKPRAYLLTLPKIGNGRMMTQQTADIKYTGSDAKVSIHFPPLPVRALVPPEVRKLSTCFPASRHSFERLPMIPAESSNKDGRLLKRERLMPVRLPPFDIKTQFSSSSSCRPESEDLHSLPRKLPPIFEGEKEKLEKKHEKKKMLPDTNGQSAECPRTDTTKKKKKKKKEKMKT